MVEKAVIGVGNPLRGDDGAGREVAKKIRGLVSSSIPVWECQGGAVELVELMGRASQVYVVDAVGGPGMAGEILRLSDKDTFDESPAASSHGLGLAAAIGLARALGSLPERLSILGIRGDRFSMGEDMGPEVAAAVDEAVRILVAELGDIHA